MELILIYVTAAYCISIINKLKRLLLKKVVAINVMKLVDPVWDTGKIKNS